MFVYQTTETQQHGDKERAGQESSSTARHASTDLFRLFALCLGVSVALLNVAYGQFPAAEAPAASGDDADPPAAADESAVGGRKVAGQSDADLPLIDDLLAELPTLEELLRDPPVDWIVVTTLKDRVLIVEPINPRPNTLEKLQQRIEEFSATRRKPTETVEERQQKFIDLHYVKVFLPGDENEYKLHVEQIQEIIHHEDQMLLRVDALIDERNFNDALQLIFALNALQPAWPGAADRHHRLLYREAETKLEADLPEAALARLAELHALRAGYPGLSKMLGTVTQQLISAAVEAGDFLQARHFLKRLRALEPNHPVVNEWSATFLSQGETLMDEARGMSRQGDPRGAAVAIERAALIWPAAPGLAQLHGRLMARYPRLHTGVLQLAGESDGYPLRVPADDRVERLTQVKLFELDSFDDVAHYRSRFFERWLPTDLGRRTMFRLTQHRAAWESVPILRSSDVVLSLSQRMNPSSPVYDDRLAARINSVRVRSPFEFELGFQQVPLRTEALLGFPVPIRLPVVDDAGAAGSSDSLSQRFVEVGRTDDTIAYCRTHPEPDNAGEFHVAEVVEHRYANYDEAIQGLLRGEVSMLARLRPRDVTPLSEDGRFFVQQTALPVTHVLQFHPDSVATRSRELRRALSYAVDRRTLLADVVLQTSQSKLGRLVTAPFPSTHNGYDPLIEQRGYDLTLAYQLAAAAKSQLGGELPELHMVCEPDPVVETVAKEMIKTWARVGIQVTLIDSGGGDPQAEQNWDVVYRTVQMYEPVFQLWPMLTLDSQATVDSLIHLPDWLRQELIELDSASDSTRSRALLRNLHRKLYAQVHLIPLWEVDDFVVLRKNIGSFGVRPVSPYQGIERWTLQPWYAAQAP